MTSTQAMISQLQGLRGTKDISLFEDHFIREMKRFYDSPEKLSEKQFNVIERIYNQHFAG